MPNRPEQTNSPARVLTQGHRITKRSPKKTAHKTGIAYGSLLESNTTAAEISLRAEIRSLKMNNKKLSNDMKCQDRQWRQLKSLYQGEPRFGEVAALVRQKNQYQNRLDAYQKDWGTFLPSHMDQIMPKDSSEMRKKVLMFQVQFDKLRIMDVIDDPFFSYPKRYSQDLKCLLTDVFGIGSATEPQGMSEVSQHGYSYHLVQALAGAALKSWVFESNFETHHFAQTELHVRFCDNLKLICKTIRKPSCTRTCPLT